MKHIEKEFSLWRLKCSRKDNFAVYYVYVLYQFLKGCNRMIQWSDLFEINLNKYK